MSPGEENFESRREFADGCTLLKIQCETAGTLDRSAGTSRPPGAPASPAHRRAASATMGLEDSAGKEARTAAPSGRRSRLPPAATSPIDSQSHRRNNLPPAHAIRCAV